MTTLEFILSWLLFIAAGIISFLYAKSNTIKLQKEEIKTLEHANSALFSLVEGYKVMTDNLMTERESLIKNLTEASTQISEALDLNNDLYTRYTSLLKQAN